eukprot:SAG22_NODE_118_length_19263_cov_16.155813_17_plen_188_part_00
MTAKNCAVTAGPQGNWGSCMGTYAFKSLALDGLRCFDPFLTTSGCPARTHYTAMHLNRAFAKDCMPVGATLSLAGIEYFASARCAEHCLSVCPGLRLWKPALPACVLPPNSYWCPDLVVVPGNVRRPEVPLDRPKCGQCETCCGGCSAAGFDQLRIDYRDASVPKGSCKAVATGPTGTCAAKSKPES